MSGCRGSLLRVTRRDSCNVGKMRVIRRTNGVRSGHGSAQRSSRESCRVWNLEIERFEMLDSSGKYRPAGLLL